VLRRFGGSNWQRDRNEKSGIAKIRHDLWLRFGGRKRLGRDLRRSVAGDDNVSVSLLLIDMGAGVDEKDPETGRTPLMVAVDYGCRTTVVALLSHGADIHIKANNGKSALDLARDKGLTEIANLLVGTHQVNQAYRSPNSQN
jgi:undecaprenyl pyrophosphate synthase